MLGFTAGASPCITHTHPSPHPHIHPHLHICLYIPTYSDAPRSSLRQMPLSLSPLSSISMSVSSSIHVHRVPNVLHIKPVSLITRTTSLHDVSEISLWLLGATSTGAKGILADARHAKRRVLADLKLRLKKCDLAQQKGSVCCALWS